MDLKPGGANPQARRALLAAAIATTAVLGAAGLAFAVSTISLSESGSPSGSSTTVDDDTSSTDDTVDDSSTTVDDDDSTSSTDSTVDDSSTSVDDDDDDATSSTDSTVDDSSTSVDDDDATSSTAGGQAAAPFDKTFATVAGTVVVQIDEGAKTVTLQSVAAASGWEFEIHKERTDRVEIRFESGDGSKVRVEARFEDGVYREEVRTDLRDDDDDDNNAGTVTTVDDDDNAGTVTTIDDDDDDDDDHSGSGSGSGSGSDDSDGGGGGGDNSGRDHPEDD